MYFAKEGIRTRNSLLEKGTEKSIKSRLDSLVFQGASTTLLLLFVPQTITSSAMFRIEPTELKMQIIKEQFQR